MFGVIGESLPKLDALDLVLYVDFLKGLFLLEKAKGSF